MQFDTIRECNFAMGTLDILYSIIFQKMFGKYCHDLTLILGHFIMHDFNPFELDKMFFHTKVNLENMQYFFAPVYPCCREIFGILYV